MQIIETSVFTELVAQNMSDHDYHALQLYLSIHPDSGDLIPGAGGLREIRWKRQGKGKRSGVRVIYYWNPFREIVLMLFVYSKNRHSDLDVHQLKQLRNLVGKEFK